MLLTRTSIDVCLDLFFNLGLCHSRGHKERERHQAEEGRQENSNFASSRPGHGAAQSATQAVCKREQHDQRVFRERGHKEATARGPGFFVAED